MFDKLIDENLAFRSEKRKNKKIKEKCPLFWEHFSTSVETELQRIERQKEEIEKHFSKMRSESVEAYERGLVYRSVAFSVLSHDRFNELEQRWLRRFPNPSPETQGFHLADHWWCALKGTEYAFENCPYKDKHNDVWPPAYNFLLGRWVAVERCPACGYPLPLTK